MKIYRIAASTSSLFSSEKCIFHSSWKSIKHVNNRFREYHIGIIEDSFDNGQTMYIVYRQYGRIGNLNEVQRVTTFQSYDRAIAKVTEMEEERRKHDYKRTGGYVRDPKGSLYDDEDDYSSTVVEEPFIKKEPVEPQNIPKLDDVARERLMRLMAGEDPQTIFMKES